MRSLLQPMPGSLPAAARERPTRGAVLLIALLVSVAIATTLTSLIALVTSSAKLADRSYYQNAAMNLAEMGIEEAIYCFNKLADVPATPRDAWEPYGWTIVTADGSVRRTLPTVPVAPGVTATVKVYCSRYNLTSIADRPVIVAQSTITFPSGPPMSKLIEVTLRKRSLFPRGMVVRETVDVDGGSSDLYLDSWDSGDDNDPATPLVPYRDETRRANASIATLSSADDAISIGNGKIYGYISTANRTGTPPRVKHGPNAALNGEFNDKLYDEDRISHDFDVTAFPLPPVPSDPVENTLSGDLGGVTLPRGTDSKSTDGYYYYNVPVGANIVVNSDRLTINAKVIIKLQSHTGVPAVTVGGTGGIAIAEGGALKVYTNGDVKISGGGVLSNANNDPASGRYLPSSCLFYGTDDRPTGGQKIELTGNGLLSVAVYAPNADIKISGGGSEGEFFGALVGKSVSMNGSTHFHYDEALARLFTGKPFSVAKWRELHTAEHRHEYADKF